MRKNAEEAYVSGEVYNFFAPASVYVSLLSILLGNIDVADFMSTIQVL